jgi:hypothetical protein
VKKERLLFEKRSKNFCLAVADPSTGVRQMSKSFLVLFFKKELLALTPQAHVITTRVRQHLQEA